MSSVKIQSLVARRPERRIYDLGQMNLRQLVVAYATYPSIVLYAVLCLASIVGAVWFGALAQPARTITAVIAAIVIYPVVEYVLHRFVLHARWLYKNPLTADLWKRIHYDHHQDPQRLDVLFGSPSNTLLPIFILALPIGWAIGGASAALSALATAFVLFMIYEFCHCVQHLNFTPKSAWLRRIKKHHMAHHFHNETGNFGITSTFVDRLVGSLYEDGKEKPKSVHTYDLGYDEAEAGRYPWVAERSGPRRERGSQA